MGRDKIPIVELPTLRLPVISVATVLHHIRNTHRILLIEPGFLAKKNPLRKTMLVLGRPTGKF